ncbi:MAG: hypothetical protein ACJ749_14040 [Flavisolibacter sp.]
MKYALTIVAFILGLVVGHYLLKQKCSNRIVLNPPSQNQNKFFTTHFLSADLYVDQAEAYLANYVKTHDESSISFSIDSEDVGKLMRLPNNARGLRAYFGVKDVDSPEVITLMFVAIDKNGENLFFKSGSKDYVVDYTNPCPRDCPPLSDGSLNRRTIKP